MGEPRKFWAGLGVCLAVTAAVTCAGAWFPAVAKLAQPLLLAPILLANLLSAWLGRRIAGEYEKRGPMRLAWDLIAAGALANAARVGFELSFLLTGQTNSAVSIALGLRQILIAGSLVMLGGGLAAMWSSFTSLRLGVKPRGVDWALIVCIVLLVPPVVVTRQRMSDAASPLDLIRYLQYASPFLLAIPAALGLVLYRISREMGEGLMALALRFLAGSFAIRLLVLAGRALPDAHGGGALVVAISAVAPLLTIGAHWMFLLGLAYRRQLSTAATDLIERYRVDEGYQLAILAKKIPGAGKQRGSPRQLQNQVVDFKLR